MNVPGRDDVVGDHRLAVRPAGVRDRCGSGKSACSAEICQCVASTGMYSSVVGCIVSSPRTPCWPSCSSAPCSTPGRRRAACPGTTACDSRSTPPLTACGSPIRSKSVLVSQPSPVNPSPALLGRHRGIGAGVGVGKHRVGCSCRARPEPRLVAGRQGWPGDGRRVSASTRYDGT